jgi:ABC-type transport system involved in multi-copper enzyme maturation permease subunit
MVPSIRWTASGKRFLKNGLRPGHQLSLQPRGYPRLLIGPVFSREAATTPRRSRHYFYRAVYVLVLLIVFWTAWLVVAGTQVIRNVGDMARFGSLLFQILAPLQLALLSFLAAFGVAGAVAQEKDRRTLILLLMTRLNNCEIVLGKLMASLLDVLIMLAAALPLFMLATLFGGISYGQVLRVQLVTLTTILAAGSLGSLLALWREKTFQTLSMTALVIVMWLGVWEAVHRGFVFTELAGLSGEAWAAAFSPARAVQLAARPDVAGSATEASTGVVWFYALMSLGIALLLNVWAIVRVRVWNPSREIRLGQAEGDEQASIWGAEHDLRTGSDARGPRGLPAPGAPDAEAARAEHVDARQRAPSPRGSTREVWDNPVLWREVCTWAYGRKVLLIRIAYVVLFAMAAWALHVTLGSGSMTGYVQQPTVIPPAASALTPFFLVSLVIINALAVNSITNERDGQSLDLLLVSDLTPKEFVFGKLGGVLWITKEMVVLPLVLSAYLAWAGGISWENLLYLVTGLLLLDVFVSTLGIHCGMTYANSRSAISVSLGAVFFLFVGVVTCIWMMISFSGSFQTQLTPFLAFIMGGSIGLYVALGFRNPSTAILWASLLLPIATFFAIVSFILRDRELTVFLVIALTYGFTTAAMIVPAISEFDIAMGRTKMAGDE